MDYASTALATGGRKGRVWTESGSIDSKVVRPASPQKVSRLRNFSRGPGEPVMAGPNLAGVPTDPQFRVDVVLSVNDGTYEITRAELTVLVIESDREVLAEVAAKAHASCPVSKVFANGISSVSVEVGGNG